MNVHLATSLTDALRFKHQYPQARPLLGGTDLLAQWQAGVNRPEDVLALESLSELRRVEVDEDGITIGAGVSHFALAHHPTIEARLPALAHAARTVGAPAIQMMGTVAGNLVNASPAADLPPALLVYEAEVVVASERGERRIALERFYLGYRRTALDADELVVGVRLAWPDPSAGSAYYKVGTRAAQSIARVALAGCLSVRGGLAVHVRFAAASVAATPVRLPAVEEAVSGRPLSEDLAARARVVASASVSPIDDVRGSAEYRRYALGALVERFVSRAAGAR
jgi:CO/xanthine dehydrogenase FAD-binding subunit